MHWQNKVTVHGWNLILLCACLKYDTVTETMCFLCWSMLHNRSLIKKKCCTIDLMPFSSID